MSNKEFVEELKNELGAEAKRMGKDISWFKFATKSKGKGWRFLADKEEQWRKIEEIAKRFANRHPNSGKGELVDLLCDLVNGD